MVEERGKFLKSVDEIEVCPKNASGMGQYSIATIINFCTNESRFIQSCIDQAQVFSKQVIVCICDHFFDGTPENRPLLEKIYSHFSHCLFLEYPFITKKIPPRIFETVTPAHFWHSFSRLIGFSSLAPEIDSILFLDADEVVDGERFAQWLDRNDWQAYSALKFANYWYFREPCHQALQFEDSVVLAQKKALRPDWILQNEERDAIYHFLPDPKRRNVMGLDDNPLFHHFSWVRSEQEMLKKVQSWGHKGDRNWPELVRKEFTRPFNGTDFIHGYQYRTVKSKFHIAFEEPVFVQNGSHANVKRFTTHEVLDLIPLRMNGFWRWF